MSIGRWMDKKAVVYIHMEYYSAIEKNAFESVLMRWMKLEPIIQSEVSQKLDLQKLKKNFFKQCILLSKLVLKNIVIFFSF